MDDERSERDPARPQSAYPDKRQEPEARYHPEGERDSELRATYGAGPRSRNRYPDRIYLEAGHLSRNVEKTADAAQMAEETEETPTGRAP